MPYQKVFVDMVLKHIKDYVCYKHNYFNDLLIFSKTIIAAKLLMCALVGNSSNKNLTLLTLLITKEWQLS